MCIFFQIGGQLKSLQIVASLTAERDGEIRKAALNTLATGYKILGGFYPCFQFRIFFTISPFVSFAFCILTIIGSPRTGMNFC